MPKEDILEDYYDKPEFAESIGKSEKTVDRMITKGLAPPITRIGKTPYFRKDSVKDWLLKQEQRMPTRRSRA